MQDISKVEKIIGVKFKNPALLESALVHRSYLNEHPDYALPHNERVEFLGDAVLELVVTEYLYNNYNNPEGELTNWRSALVKTESLLEVCQSLGLDKFLILSKGEQRAEGRARNIISANALEAIIGAIYLDQGYDVAKKFIDKYLVSRLKDIIKNKLYIDAKSHLQELAQEQEGITPNYTVLEESGPDHAKSFVVGVFINERELGRGEGFSKQEAQQKAAEEALKTYSH